MASSSPTVGTIWIVKEEKLISWREDEDEEKKEPCQAHLVEEVCRLRQLWDESLGIATAMFLLHW